MQNVVSDYVQFEEFTIKSKIDNILNNDRLEESILENVLDSIENDQRCARNAGSKNGTHANARNSKNWHAETHADFLP